MADEPVQMRWANAEWLEEVHAWVKEQAAAIGRPVVGTITQPHVRPWATAMRVPTDSGTLWFKATCPGLPHESRITEALSRWLPGRTPEVLECRPDRNWLLMADGGVTLRSVLKAGAGPKLASTVAEVYAGLQRAVATRVDAMIALGVPDCRLATFAEQYARLLDETAILCVGEEECLTEEELARLQDLVPLAAALSCELADFGIPETLQHDDLHSNNVLLRGEHVTFFDWGDCSVSHPLYSLVVLLRGFARDYDVPEDSPILREVRDAFLAAWDLPLTAVEIDRACVLADALGRISRALTWRRVLRGMEDPHFSAYVPAVSGWLQEFLAVVDAVAAFTTHAPRGHPA